MSNLEIYLPAPNRVELRRYEHAPLGSGEVRGRTLASIDSPGSILAILGGAMPGSLPARPGHAAVFEVDEVGSEVTSVAPGDRLLCQGSNRSTQQFVSHLTAPVPAGLDPVTAVLARLMGVSMTTLMTTSARPGDLVAVTGLGPVGYLAAHLFRLANYEVIAAAPDARRRRLAADSGITEVYAQLPADDAAVAGRVDLVVECSGNEAAVADDREGLVAADEAFHRTLIRLSDHELLGQLWAGLYLRIHQIMSLRNDREVDLVDIAGTHPPIVRALEAGDVEQAVRLVSLHADALADFDPASIAEHQG